MQTFKARSPNPKTKNTENQIFEHKQQFQEYIQEISRACLMLEMIDPLFCKEYSLNKQKQMKTKRNLWSQYPFLQSLNMDLTSYQTLKQLIIENKSLVDESQSAYFLSKQAHKLISFIDGYHQLQKGQNFIQENFLERSETEKEKQEKKINQKMNLKSQIQEESDQEYFEKEFSSENTDKLTYGQNMKITKNISERPPLIKQQQESALIPQENNSNSYQSDDQEPEIQIQIVHNQPKNAKSHPNEENDMNSSNIMLTKMDQSKKNKEQEAVKTKKIKDGKKNLSKGSKVIRLYTGIHQKTDSLEFDSKSIQSGYKKSNFFTKQNENPNHEEIANLSQIIRPEYQKTQNCINSSSQCLQSSQAESENRQNQESSYENSNFVRIIPQDPKKKIIPLLKKGKSSVGYNEMINATKLASLSRIVQQKSQNIYLQKGFISQDTDANSRISSMTTNQGFLKENQSKQQQNKRSLSPKLQRPKKPQNEKIKISIKRNSSENHQNSVQNGQKKKDRQKQSQIEIELRQLEEEFTNRNLKKTQNVSEKLQASESGISQDASQIFQIQEVKSVHKENKTLKLIKKTSSQNLKSHNASNSISDYLIQQDHLPLTSNTQKNAIKKQINMQKNSVVLEEEPWECDQLELEEELKALDQKIQGRKSMLTLNQTLDPLARENTETVTGKTQNIHKNSQFSGYQTHKRSNTASSNLPVYIQHLFEDQNELFDKNGDSGVQNTHQEPKVVRLSLNALSHKMGRKSRDSKGVKNRESNVIRKDESCQQLKKQPSCKSILLYEQAEKRGISPSKSTKSLKHNQNIPVKKSPLKQNPSSKPNGQPKTPKVQREALTTQQNFYQTENSPYNLNSRTLSDLAESESTSRNYPDHNSSQSFTINNRHEDALKIEKKRNKMVLLSDQLGD